VVSDEPHDNGGQEGESRLKRSEHAGLRFGQGRPIPQVVNDVQKAGPREVFIQPEDGRFVVRGARSREHIIEFTGEHVTSVRRSEAAHQARLSEGTIRPAEEDEIKKLKEFVE
jgi:hypothetical protein